VENWVLSGEWGGAVAEEVEWDVVLRGEAGRAYVDGECTSAGSRWYLWGIFVACF